MSRSDTNGNGNGNGNDKSDAKHVLQYIPVLSILAAIVAFGIRIDTRQDLIMKALPEGGAHRLSTVEKDTRALEEQMGEVEEALSRIQGQLEQLLKK